jgi:hypothetical protein
LLLVAGLRFAPLLANTTAIWWTIPAAIISHCSLIGPVPQATLFVWSSSEDVLLGTSTHAVDSTLKRFMIDTYDVG